MLLPVETDESVSGKRAGTRGKEAPVPRIMRACHVHTGKTEDRLQKTELGHRAETPGGPVFLFLMGHTARS